jgi:hypothetical protein
MVVSVRGADGKIGFLDGPQTYQCDDDESARNVYVYRRLVLTRKTIAAVEKYRG